MRRNYLYAAITFFVIGLLVMTTALIHAQEWHTANQATITWDAVTMLANGEPIPENSVIEYRVWLSNADTDPDKSAPVQLPGEISETSYVITLNTEGRFFVGLQTLRKSQDGIVLAESVVGWTDDPEIVSEGITFGLQYFLPPAPPHGAALL